MDISYLLFFGTLIVFLIWNGASKSYARLKLPPGPRESIISGVQKQLPTSEPWKTYAEWGKKFGGPLLSFRVYNRRIIVLNDASAIKELFDQRSNIYSDRPKSWMYGEICDRKRSVFNISSLDERHKKYRKILQIGLGRQATQDYWPLLQSEAITLLNGLAATPAKFEGHLRRNAAAVIMKMTFGYTVTADDHFISVAEEAAKISRWAMAPGRWLVDYLPILRFIPSYFPGAAWKRQGEKWRERLHNLSEVPHEWVKQQMASGDYTESFTSRLLRSDGQILVNAEQEDINKWCAGGLYAGAMDTTVSALMSFILLMALHPEAQRKAQSEIYEVVGLDHFPHPSQLGRLVYLMAVFKEVLRYAPVANLALPHMITETDEYAGYRIPKGATIVANVWAVMHDVDIYPEPFTFSPERFISSQYAGLNMNSSTIQADPRSSAFGFGRRTCPGIPFAETSMLLIMASILAKFDISLPSSAKEDPVTRPNVEFTSGITSHIKPFEIIISPRSDRV